MSLFLKKYLSKIAFLFASILLVYLSLFPRITEVVSGNYVFTFDQGRDYLAVSKMVIGHKVTLIGSEIGAGSAGFQGIFQGPFHYYFLSIPFILFHGDPYGGMVWMLCASLLAIVLAFYSAYKMWGITSAFLAGILVAVSPPLISHARLIWNSNPSSVFILLTFYFMYLFLKDKKGRDLFLTAFFSGFIYNFQIAIATQLCVSLIIFIAVILREKKIYTYCLLLGGFIVAFSPMILFELRHHFLGISGIIDYVIHHKGTEVTVELQKRLFFDHLGSFIYNFIDTFPRTFIPPVILFSLIVLPALYYMLKEKNNTHKRLVLYLCLIPFVSFFVMNFLRNSIYPYYLIHLNVVYIFLATYSFFKMGQSGNKVLLLLFTFLFVSMLSISIPFSMRNFLFDVKDYGGTAKIRGLEDAIDYIYKDAKGEKFGVLVFAPPIYTYQYDYTLDWYAQRKYSYVPYKEKKGLFYLWIEVDPSKPWSYKGWLETVIKDGTVISEKKLPSGFLIQKRIVKDEI